MPPRLIEHDGRALSISAWSRQPHQRALGLSRGTIGMRLDAGWTAEQALTIQLGCRVPAEGPAAVLPNVPYAADVAAQLMVSTGPATLEQVADALGLTRERVRQIEAEALAKLRKRAPLVRLTPGFDHVHVSTGRHEPSRTRPAPAAEVVAPVVAPAVEDGLQSSPWRELEHALVRGTRAAEALLAILDEVGAMEAA